MYYIAATAEVSSQALAAAGGGGGVDEVERCGGDDVGVVRVLLLSSGLSPQQK